MNEYGAHDMVTPLRRVMMKRPGTAMGNAKPEQWHYAGSLRLNRLQTNHDALVRHIRAAGVEIIFLDEDPGELADLVFTHDPSMVIRQGAVILRMGKRLRQGETSIHAEFYQRQGIPILGAIDEPGTVEGGDCVWLDDQTLVVGLGFRTNDAGLDQLQRIVAGHGVHVQPFDLPVFEGSDACLHLMSLISMLDHNLALIYSPLFPVRLLQFLERRGIECLPAPHDEFMSSGGLSTNVLALAPRNCVMVDGFPATFELLQSAGCTISTFPGNELCLKAEGGPTCLTRPILRSV